MSPCHGGARLFNLAPAPRLVETLRMLCRPPDRRSEMGWCRRGRQRAVPVADHGRFVPDHGRAAEVLARAYRLDGETLAAWLQRHPVQEPPKGDAL